MERATDSGDGTGQMAQPWMFMMIMITFNVKYIYTLKQANVILDFINHNFLAPEGHSYLNCVNLLKLVNKT
jgi:hypothetical protein